MKKSFITLSLMLAAMACAQAKEITESQARGIAASVIPSLSASEAAPRRAPGLKNESPSPYYLFNADKGYVIVAGDDRLPAVLGYSLDGHLEADNMPDALNFLLGMSAAIEGEAQSAMAVSTGTPVVQPLLGDINWGQDAPFNSLCPMVGSQRGYVGCVATAMGQIMRFYGYPAQGTGTHSYVDGTTQHSVDFGSTTYDWANMPNAVPSSPSQAQIDAYSTLSYHLGVAVNMKYASGGSGAYTMDVPGALRDHFGYTKSLRMHLRDYYNTEEWMDMIKSELDAHRPVYYSASSEDGLGGHAFVCDGYDSEGYVHINWGWYGSANGYFYINHLNPDELGTGGGGGAYNISQEILTHFMPAQSGDKPEPAIYSDTRFSCDSFGTDMMTMCFITNLDTDPFDGDILTVVTSADGQILKVLKREGVSIDPFKSGKSGMLQLTMRDIPTTADGLADGKYQLRMAYQTAEMDAPKILRHPIGLPAYSECFVMDGQIILSEKHEPKPDVTMITPLAPDGEIYANGSARFYVSVRNDSRDFRLSTIILTLTNVANPEITYSKEYYVNVYDLSTGDLTMAMELPESIVAGKYSVTLAHKNHLDKPFSTHDGKETIIEVLPEINSPVIRFTSSPIWQNGSDASATKAARGEMVYIAAYAKNYAASGETMVICRLTDANGKSSVLGADSYAWTKGELRTLVITNYVNADPGTYTMAYSYIGADGLEKPINAPEETIEITESDYTAIEVTDFTIPTAIKSGERVSCSITIKGLANTTGTLYVRVRQLNYKNGEIVTMKSGVKVVAGEEQTLTFNYRPGVADGTYLTIVEFKDGASTFPAGGHENYYKEIAIGETAGIDGIEADNDAPEQWYTIQGIEIARPTSPGVYIRKQGAKAEKVAIF